MSDSSDWENSEHVDIERVQQLAANRDEVNRIAREEREALGLDKRRYQVRLVADVRTPDVRKIREGLKLSQAEFAQRFGLRERTIQQWEQGRALPDRPARVLLRTIERHPEVVAAAAATLDQPGAGPRSSSSRTAR